MTKLPHYCYDRPPIQITYKLDTYAMMIRPIESNKKNNPSTEEKLAQLKTLAEKDGNAAFYYAEYNYFYLPSTAPVKLLALYEKASNMGTKFQGTTYYRKGLLHKRMCLGKTPTEIKKGEEKACQNFYMAILLEYTDNDIAQSAFKELLALKKTSQSRSHQLFHFIADIYTSGRHIKKNPREAVNYYSQSISYLYEEIEKNKTYYCQFRDLDIVEMKFRNAQMLKQLEKVLNFEAIEMIKENPSCTLSSVSLYIDVLHCIQEGKTLGLSQAALAKDPHEEAKFLLQYLQIQQQCARFENAVKNYLQALNEEIIRREQGKDLKEKWKIKDKFLWINYELFATPDEIKKIQEVLQHYQENPSPIYYYGEISAIIMHVNIENLTSSTQQFFLAEQVKIELLQFANYSVNTSIIATPQLPPCSALELSPATSKPISTSDSPHQPDYGDTTAGIQQILYTTDTKPARRLSIISPTPGASPQIRVENYDNIHLSRDGLLSPPLKFHAPVSDSVPPRMRGGVN